MENQLSAVAEYLVMTGHTIKWDEAQVIECTVVLWIHLATQAFIDMGVL